MSACNCCEEPVAYWHISYQYRSAQQAQCGDWPYGPSLGKFYSQNNQCESPSLLTEVSAADRFLKYEGFDCSGALILSHTWDPETCTYTVTGPGGSTPNMKLSMQFTDAMVESYLATKLAAATWSDWNEFDNTATRALGAATELKYRIDVCHLPTTYLKVWFLLQQKIDSGSWSDIPPPAPIVITDATLHHATWVTPPPDPWNPSYPYLVCDYIPLGEAGITAPLMSGSTVTQRLTVAKFSYLPDYEPDILDPLNPQPSGFPDPAWEPAAP